MCPANCEMVALPPFKMTRDFPTGDGKRKRNGLFCKCRSWARLYGAEEEYVVRLGYGVIYSGVENLDGLFLFHLGYFYPTKKMSHL